MSQLSFEFESPQTPSPRHNAEPRASVPALPEMARLLDAHPDYRVLRRLVPVNDYGPPPPAPATGEATAVAQRVLLLDTETTGLSHASDRIIELAMLMVQVDGRTGAPFGPVEAYEGFEDPGMPIPETARQVTGITDDMVRGQHLDDARVNDLLARADWVVAHNAGFDRPFVEARFSGFAQKPWACSFADIDWKARGADSARLGALALDRGWFYDAHRALVDCHALLQVLCCQDNDAPTTVLASLLRAGAQPSYRLRATGAPFESKDKLKARGYRWDADARVWFCSVGSEEALSAEQGWLKDEVYGARRAQLELEALDAMTRYSGRPGRRALRQI